MIARGAHPKARIVDGVIPPHPSGSQARTPTAAGRAPERHREDRRPSSTTIHAAATRAHVTFVDTTDVFVGHAACSGSSWVNPVSLDGQLQAHPTVELALERAVAAALDLTIKT